MEFIFLTLLATGVTGTVGLLLGLSLGRPLSGFFLGAFLGPIGWIIVFLLPRDATERAANQPLNEFLQFISNKPEADLESDSYRIWLAKKYQIKKNDLFEKYECKEQLFETLQDALHFAHEQEESQKLSEDLEIYKKPQHKRDLEEDGEDQDDNTGFFVFLAGGIFIFLLVAVVVFR